jgi:ATP-binding cassette subfamily B protein
MNDEHLEEDVFRGGFDWATWKVLFARLRDYRSSAITVAVTAALLAGTHVVFGLLVGAIIDDIESGQGRWPVYVCVNFVLVAMSVVGVVVFIMAAGRMASHVSCDLRRDGFRHLQELSFSFYDRRSVGWLVARLTTDCDRLSRIMAWGLLELVWGAFFVILTVAAMFVLCWELALVVVAVVPVIWYASVFFQRRLLNTSREVRRTNSRITAAFGECINGVRATRTMVREDENLSEFRDLTGLMYERSVRNAILRSAFLPVVLMLASISIAATMWAGGIMVDAKGIEVSILVVFVLYARQIFRPVMELAYLLTEFQHAHSAAERIVGLLETSPDVNDSPQATEGEDLIESIEFEDVRFSYDEREEVIRGFDLKVGRGETIALVGPTGGGKTTLISLLCRFYEPTSGRVMVNGADYCDRTLHWLQSRLGIVLQSPHLFSGTIRDNIRYGRPDASDEDILSAAKLVHAHEFIIQTSNGYDTEVGEGGSALSVGQCQLVTLARAVLADPQILVMDEATASVDSVTERAIQQGMEQVIRGRISIIIAHRLSTVRAADRILVVDKGRISEQGTHADLLARRGEYCRLYMHQFAIERTEELLS